MAELKHQNHEGIEFELVGSELRATVTGAGLSGEQIDLAAVGSSGGGAIEYTLQSDDNGALFVYHGSDEPVINVPAALGAGFRAGFVLRPPDDAVVTIAPDGSWHASSPVGPLELEMGEQDDGPVALTLTIQELGSDPLLHVAGSGSKPYLVRVFYDEGWPASRPVAQHVDAVGGTSEPSWLTSADMWFELVLL